MATRADGQPADQHARARSIAEFLYQSNPSTTGPPPSPYVDGIDVPLSPDTSIDSPQFWGAFIHMLNNRYAKKPGNLAMARMILNPDGFGFATQDNILNYWRTTIDSFDRNTAIGRFAHNPAKFTEYAMKYANYSYDIRMVFIKWFQLTGIRWNATYDNPDTLGILARSMFNFYSQNKDIAKKAGAAYRSKEGIDAARAAFAPFFEGANAGFAYSSLSQLHGGNQDTIIKYFYRFRDYPQVLYWMKKTNAVLGINFGPGWIGNDDPARQAVYIFNQIAGRLMQREHLSARVALRRLATNQQQTLPNQSTAKLVMFYYHAMCEVADNPNSSWKSQLDNKFADMIPALNSVKNVPRVWFWKWNLWTMLDMNVSDAGSVEWSAACFNFLVYFYSTPGLLGSKLNYYRDCYKTDTSPGSIATVYDMVGGMFTFLRSGNPSGMFTPGRGFATTTPRQLFLAATANRDEPVVKAAIENFVKFMEGSDASTTRETVDGYVAKLLETYQAAVSNL